MTILLTICARGGSKGIPGKNIRPLNGKPLLQYTIETANRFLSAVDHHCDISLSTDDPRIARVAAQAGLVTDYRRPPALGSDTAGKIDVIAELLNHEEERTCKRYDYVIDLDVTSPLRTVDDLRQALAELEGTAEALNIFSVSPAHRNPYFNMVEVQADGFVTIAKKRQGGAVLTRQSAPVVYDMNASFYIYRRKFFDMRLTSAITSTSLAYLVPHICFDLDVPLDFDLMEYLIARQKLDFTF